MLARSLFGSVGRPKIPLSLDSDFLYRSDSRKFNDIIRTGLSSKGNNKNLEQHVQNNVTDSFYISTSSFMPTALKFGVFHFNLIAIAKPLIYIDVANCPFIPKDQNNQTQLSYDPDGVISNFGMIENEISVPSKVNIKDIFHIENRRGFRSLSLVMDRFLNPNYAPHPIVFSVLSADVDQHEEYQFQLRKHNRIDDKKRILNPAEILAIKKYLPARNKDITKQFSVFNVPRTLSDSLIKEYVLDYYSRDLDSTLASTAKIFQQANIKVESAKPDIVVLQPIDRQNFSGMKIDNIVAKPDKLIIQDANSTVPPEIVREAPRKSI